MKVLLVGPKWFGNNVEYCKNAFKSFGVLTKVFYYNVPSSDSGLSFKNKAKNCLNENSNQDDRLLLNFYKVLKKDFDKKKIISKNDQLLKTCEEYEPDAVFIMKGETLFHETIRAIKRKCPVYFWWFDNPFEYAKIHSEILDNLKVANHVFIIEPYYIELLKEIGVKKISYLGNGCEPKIYNRKPLSAEDKIKYECDLSFVGTCYPKRYQILKDLVDYDLKIYGVQWFEFFKKGVVKKAGVTIKSGVVTPELQVKIFQNTKINLNFHRPNLVNCANQRTYEIACAGGFQLIHYKKLIADEFEEGKEMVYYRSLDDLKDKINYYLENENERKEIAHNSQKKCLESYTYSRRFEGVIGIMRGN